MTNENVVPVTELTAEEKRTQKEARYADRETPSPSPAAKAGPITLSSILHKAPDSLTSWIEFKDGISFHLRYIKPQTLLKVSQDAVYHRYDDKAKGRVRDIDQKKLTRDFCAKAVIGWKGVTPRSLQGLTTVNIEGLTEEQKDTEIAYDLESLLKLIDNTYDLDTFLQNSSTDVKFFKPEHEVELKN